MRDIEQAVRAQPRVRAAREAVQVAQERRGTVAGEVGALEDDLEALEARIRSVTEAGDPEGEIRDLSRQRRDLRDKLEDAGADLAAQDAAVRGAVRSEARAVLAAMDEVWVEQPLDAVEERVRDAVEELGAALDELAALNVEHKRLHDWSTHLVGRVLDGEGQAPRLQLPNLEIPVPDLQVLIRGVAACRHKTPEPDKQGVAA